METSAIIRDLGDDDVERRSRRSYATSRGSSRRSETASKAAELKTKLKYLDVEASARLELDRIRTMKELDITEAKLEIMDDVKSELDDAKRSLPQENMMKTFLDQIPIPNVQDKDITVNHDHALNNTNPHSQRLDEKYHDDKTYVEPNVVINKERSRYRARTPEPSERVKKYDDVPKLIPSSKLPKENSKSFISPLNPSAETFLPRHDQLQITNVPLQATSSSLAKHENTSSDDDITKLAKVFAEQMNLSRLPPPEPVIFNGDPLKYPGWKAAFQTLIEQRQIPPSERIHYLRKYLSDQVREVVENLFLLSTDEAYNEAKSLLDQRYGDPFVIANAFRDKLDNWPKVAGRDGYGLRKLSDFIKQCYTAMQSIGTLNVLNDDRENRKILTKLPDWIVTRWARIVNQHKEEYAQFPTFKVFVEFLEKEAKIACDPITSIQNLKPEVNRNNYDRNTVKVKPTTTRGPRYQGRTLRTDTSEESTGSTALATHNNYNRKKCRLCKGFHDLDDCKDFNAKTIEARKEYAKRNNLCFGCLGGDHTSKRCRNRKKCSKCSKSHPTSLHDDYVKWQSNESADKNRQTTTREITHSSVQTGTVHLNSTAMGSKSSMIVPVYVSHCDNPSYEQLVYALLDTQSDTTFILDKTCNDLGLTGTKVNLSLSTMYSENQLIESYKVKGLSVRGFDSSMKIELPTTFTRNIMPANKSHIPTADMARRWTHLEDIANRLPPIQECEVGLLIGYNCPRALTPREVIPCDVNGPYGLRTDLGWSIVGIVDPTWNDTISDLDEIGLSHRIMVLESLPNVDDQSEVYLSMRSKVKEVIDPHEITRMFELDFNEQKHQIDKRLSRDDQVFLETLKEEIHVDNGHYEMPLPFKGGPPNLSNNKTLALQRFKHLERKLRKDEKYEKDYVIFMTDMIQKGFAEKVPDDEIGTNDGREWYIPHHGVYHPHKPGKLRVVFDCSARYLGQCLNDHLLQGPDLTNALIGVLCRFRKEPIAFVCDVEQMFHQFKVNVEHRNYLRFLWYENGDANSPPVEYRMTVHLFGAASSPGCANFGLKQLADDKEDEYGTSVANFIKRDFYVDDGLKSMASVDEAVNMIEKSVAMCKQGGLRLHKFLSNSKDVLAKIPEEDRAKGLNLDITNEALPITKTLGIEWNAESDEFRFKMTLENKPITRRGMLSTLNSIYDPLGVISPIVLKGKKLLQETCRDQTDWDSPLPKAIEMKWEKWKRDLSEINDITIKRCVKPSDFGSIKSVEIHNFSDASSTGYGQCSYLRLIDENDRVHCSLLMGKARVTPLKQMTIPRLELTAAVVSMKVGAMLRDELQYANVVEYYWTDSQVVLGYIANDSRRFHVFVANRVQQIRDNTTPSQWHYVTSSENPADIASRGATPQELVSSNWFTGPDFLLSSNPLDKYASSDTLSNLMETDPEIRKVSTLSTQSVASSYATLSERLEIFSDWKRARSAVAGCIRYRDILLSKVRGTKFPSKRTTVDDIRRAEIEIIKSVQKSAFKEELEILHLNDLHDAKTSRESARNRNARMKEKSSLYRLDPILDSDGLIRVGGRIRRSDFDLNLKHPIILPKKSHITNIIIRHLHVKSGHQGRGMTINALRSHGYWVIGCSSKVTNMIKDCVTCRKHRNATQGQKMADLPADRLEQVPPFTYTGVDFFGPWYIKEGRKEMKRYGVVFTCLSCRAIHLETANSLDTSSFINALRRFISIRGQVRHIRSDRGTNFVGAERELREAYSEMDSDKIRQFLNNEGCDYMQFKMNVPSASHMGGVWERQIRTVRNVLTSLMKDCGTHLDDESLRTFMCEAAAIVNSRPLTLENLNDPLSAEPLTPNHLLTMKSNIILPPPGNFQGTDIYCRKRWRRVQYLANQFWSRWKREYINSLQTRQKWTDSKRNIRSGDIVLIKDENTNRNIWQVGRVKETLADEDGLVRTAKLTVGSSRLDKDGKRGSPLNELERPIHKLVLLLETED